MTQKFLNLTKELGKYWKVFNVKYMFGGEWFYRNRLSNHHLLFYFSFKKKENVPTWEHNVKTYTKQI